MKTITGKLSPTLLVLAILAGPSSASIREIAYAGGKQSGSVEIVTSSGNPLQSILNPDTVRIGGLTVRLYNRVDGVPAACSFKPLAAALFDAPLGSVRQSPDMSADWDRFGGHPDTTIPVDTLSGPQGAGYPSAVMRGTPAVGLFKAGGTNTCMGSEYFMEPNWNRIVFLRFGSGVDYRAKLSFQAKRDTVWGFNPQYQVITSITLHYVLNANSNDLSGPAAVLPKPTGGFGRTGVKVDYDLYNPLGVRLSPDGGRGRFEPALPAARRAR